MSTLKITISEVSATHHGFQKAGGAAIGDYVHHSVSASAQIKIGNSQDLYVVWQTGCSYRAGDYGCPSNKMEVSKEGGTTPIIFELANMYESDFDNEETTTDLAARLSEIVGEQVELAQLFSIYTAIHEATPIVWSLIDDAHSDDIDLYNEEYSEEFGTKLTLK